MNFAELFFNYLDSFNDFIWEYIGLVLIIPIGIYFTLKSKFFQLRVLANPKKHITNLVNCESRERGYGTHPLKLYFASIGGMIGLGNIVTVVATVTIGGPGSLVWLWIASVLGMLVKYAEIYLGVKYRVKSKDGYDGGPMYYLMHAFGSKAMCVLVCIFLCIYGVEVSQFLILADTMVSTFSIEKYWAIAILLPLVLISSVGGVKRLANLCSVMMPPFMLIYLIFGIWIIIDNAAAIPELLSVIWHSAFHGHAPIGGFAGSTMLMAAHYGVSRAVYSGDIGIGYDSIINSETQVANPTKQARLAIFSLFTDSLICTISIMVVMVTGLWTVTMQPSEYVAAAMSMYSQHAGIFISILLFISGFTTIVGYMVVGSKCANYLNPRIGRSLFIAYAIFAFSFFSFFDQEQVILIMTASGGILLLFNLLGVFKLRKEISFT